MQVQTRFQVGQPVIIDGYEGTVHMVEAREYANGTYVERYEVHYKSGDHQRYLNCDVSHLKPVTAD